MSNRFQSPALNLASIALATTLCSVEADAAEKIVFSGRDGRKVQYHRSLNARPLFALTTLEASKGDQTGATDGLFAAPAMIIREDRAKPDDEDWAFKSTDELLEDQIGDDMTELTEEMQDLEEAGRKRSQVEKFLDRRREERGEIAARGSDAKEQTQPDQSAKSRESAVHTRTELQKTSPAGAGLRPMDQRAVSSASTARANASAPAAPRPGTVMSPRAFMEFQKEHVAQLKQTLGVSGSAATPPPSASAISQTGPNRGPAKAAQNAVPLNGPVPGNTGVYPGLQGLGLTDLTSPTATQNGITPLQPRSGQPPTDSRERRKPMRFKAPKRNVF